MKSKGGLSRDIIYVYKETSLVIYHLQTAKTRPSLCQTLPARSPHPSPHLHASSLTPPFPFRMFLNCIYLHDIPILQRESVLIIFVISYLQHDLMKSRCTEFFMIPNSMNMLPFKLALLKQVIGDPPRCQVYRLDCKLYLRCATYDLLLINCIFVHRDRVKLFTR